MVGDTERNTLICYHGAVTHDVIESMSGVLMKKLKAYNESRNLIMALYGVFIELAQNIERYSAEKQIAEGNILSYGMIKVTRHSEASYTVETENKVGSEEKDILGKYLDEIINLDILALKDRYKKTLLEGTDGISENAGLGILEMAVKSRNNIVYEFKNIGLEMYSFLIKIKLGG